MVLAGASHSVHESRPKEVAAVIKDAAMHAQHKRVLRQSDLGLRSHAFSPDCSFVEIHFTSNWVHQLGGNPLDQGQIDGFRLFECARMTTFRHNDKPALWNGGSNLFRPFGRYNRIGITNQHKGWNGYGAKVRSAVDSPACCLSLP